jgi:hypothetical protein
MARISGPFAFRSQPCADASPYTQINCLQNLLGGSARTPQPFGRCRLGSRNVVSEVWPSCSPNTTIRRCRPNVLNNSRAAWNRPPDRARPTKIERNAAAATSLLRLRCGEGRVRNRKFDGKGAWNVLYLEQNPENARLRQQLTCTKVIDFFIWRRWRPCRLRRNIAYSVRYKTPPRVWSNEVAVNALANGTQMTRGPL